MVVVSSENVERSSKRKPLALSVVLRSQIIEAMGASSESIVAFYTRDLDNLEQYLAGPNPTPEIDVVAKTCATVWASWAISQRVATAAFKANIAPTTLNHIDRRVHRGLNSFLKCIMVLAALRGLSPDSLVRDVPCLPD
jgi:hypothetical protein